MKLEPQTVEEAFDMVQKGFAAWEIANRLGVSRAMARRLYRESHEYELSEVLDRHTPSQRKPYNRGARLGVASTGSRARYYHCSGCGSTNLQPECLTCQARRAKQERKDSAKRGLYVQEGNVFSSGAEAVVIPVNCVGVMGAGLALQARKRFAGLSASYQQCCREGVLTAGTVFTWRAPTARKDGFQWVFCFPTKLDWRDPSHLQLVAQGLAPLRAAIQTTQTTSVAVPALGCGLGGLEWDSVEPLMVQALQRIPGTKVLIYRPRPEN